MRSLNYYKALADITRIRIYNILLENELSVNELVRLMDIGQSGISRHLKILTDSGLLCCRRSGVWAFYSADNPTENQSFIDAAKQLFESEPVLIEDLDRAEQIVTDRHLETKRFFNTIAHKWDFLKQEIIGDFDLNAEILKLLNNSGVVADLGCGTGELLSILNRSATKVIGVDSSSNMLEEAKKRLAGSLNTVDLRLGELEQLPLRDQEADTAVISLALRHLSKPEAAFAEASRILKPGGTLVIAEFNRHENVTFQKKYGDRWPGFSEFEISGWLTDNTFNTCTVSSYSVKQSLIIRIYKSVKI